MLYGCEVWGNITKTELMMLNKVQKVVAKSIQNLNWRTHDEIVRGLLGWYTIEAYIDRSKRMFICKLVHMDPCSVTKQVFLKQLYSHITCRNIHNTITYDLLNVLKSYNLQDYLYSYLAGGTFPPKAEWKNIIKYNIYRSEENKWKQGLVQKGCHRYINVQPKLEENILYNIIKQNLRHKPDLMVLLKMLTVPENYEESQCDLCKSLLNDPVEHTLLHCQCLIEERNIMWDNILNNLDIKLEAELFSAEDSEVLAVLMGKASAFVVTPDEKSNFYIGISQSLNIFLNRLNIAD